MYCFVSLPIFFICRRCVDNFIISLILFPSSFVNTTLELYYNSEIYYMYKSGGQIESERQTLMGYK